MTLDQTRARLVLRISVCSGAGRRLAHKLRHDVSELVDKSPLVSHDCQLKGGNCHSSDSPHPELLKPLISCGCDFPACWWCVVKATPGLHQTLSSLANNAHKGQRPIAGTHPRLEIPGVERGGEKRVGPHRHTNSRIRYRSLSRASRTFPPSLPGSRRYSCGYGHTMGNAQAARVARCSHRDECGPGGRELDSKEKSGLSARIWRARRI